MCIRDSLGTHVLGHFQHAKPVVSVAVDLNVDAGFYFKQSRGGTCTRASAAMMLRRRAYFDGRTDWVDVTENSVRSTAWSNGLDVYKRQAPG